MRSEPSTVASHGLSSAHLRLISCGLAGPDSIKGIPDLHVGTATEFRSALVPPTVQFSFRSGAIYRRVCVLMYLNTEVAMVLTGRKIITITLSTFIKI